METSCLVVTLLVAYLMQLIKARLHGYKRFAEKSTMTVNGKVIAIIGPNEAGKSSFLQALEHLNHDRAFNAQEGSRELTREEEPTNDQKIVWALFRLDETDEEIIRNSYFASFNPSSSAQMIEVWKLRDGKRTCRLSELLPRDGGIRSNLKTALGVEANNIQQLGGLNQNQKVQLTKRFDKLSTSLDSQEEKSSKNSASELEHAIEIKKQLQGKSSKELDEALTHYIENETEIQSFEDQIQKYLLTRIPDILLFDDESRELKSSYDATKITKQGKAVLNIIG